ncbi:MAG TPA: HypC/HybG/HupF family hydrogenase formation chaperone [Candidatus Ratteibacteria bacterium]|nr:HypC/HybG/HupF family hydrogenase formation chaperone [Candidatus Ratteibacteria bacterium]
MCLAVPMKVEKVMKDNFAIVSLGTVKKKVNISLVKSVKKGNYLIVHAGFAITKLDKKQAGKTLKLLNEMGK